MRRRNNLQKEINFRVWYLLPILLFFLGLIFLIKILIQLPILKDIECKSQYGECAQNIKDKLSQLDGQKLATAYQLIKEIMKEEPQVEKYNIQYLPPSKIKVNVAERQAKYVMVRKGQELMALIDSSGTVLGFTQNSDLPKVVSEGGTINKRDVVSAGELFALELTSDISKTFQIYEGLVKNNSLIVELSNHVKVIFPLEGDRQLLMGSLILIYNDLSDPDGSKLNKEGLIVDTIDLRFNNPVIRIAM